VRAIRLHFLLSLGLGAVVWLLSAGQHEMLRILLAADVFFALYVGLSVGRAFGGGAGPPRALGSRFELRAMAVLAALAVVVSLVAIFTLLNHPRAEGRFFPIVAVASVPLSWAMQHIIASQYYARLYYGSVRGDGAAGGLGFPEGGHPSELDFLYYAFVIGTSYSVSDVNTLSRELRVATFVHSISSFTFNTVLVAIAVNAAMTFAG
jgi:uncharacterized membrane protein